MNDESKLPKWAQTEMRTLRSRLAAFEAHVSAAHPGTNVALVDGRGERPLPKNSRPRFALPSGRIDVVFGGAQQPKDVLVIRSLDGDLIVSPSSSNVVYVRTEER